MDGLNSLISVFFALGHWSTLAFKSFNCSGVTVLVDGVPVKTGAGGFVAVPASCFLSASISASCAAVFLSKRPPFPAPAVQTFPAFVSIADRNQPVDLSPGPGRRLRTSKGQKTTPKLFSVSYFFSCSDATHQACTPVQNGITNSEFDQPKLTDLGLGRSNCWRSATGGRFSMAGQKMEISMRGVVSTQVADTTTGTSHGVVSIFP